MFVLNPGQHSPDVIAAAMEHSANSAPAVSKACILRHSQWRSGRCLLRTLSFSIFALALGVVGIASAVDHGQPEAQAVQQAMPAELTPAPALAPAHPASDTAPVATEPAAFWSEPEQPAAPAIADRQPPSDAEPEAVESEAAESKPLQRAEEAPSVQPSAESVPTASEPESLSLRDTLRDWLLSNWEKLAAAFGVIGTIFTIVGYIEQKRRVGPITIPKLQAQLLDSIKATYRRQKEAAEAIVGDWQERERQLEAALKQRDAQLQRIHALAEEFQRIASGADADTIASKLTRILQEQGPFQALDYIETQREDIVARYLADRAANLAKLEPLLASAGLYASEGEAEQARGLYAQIVELAPDWPEALDAHRWFLIDQGDLAMIRGTLDAAERDFALARQRVETLIALQPEEPRWQRNLGLCFDRTGDVKVARGDLDGAQEDYESSLAILERLAADEPGNAGWQRDLSVSLNKLGDVKVARGDLDGAQQDYEGSLAIMVRQAADEPGNAGWQRDLAVSHYKLGTVADARGDQRALAQHWSAMLAIFDALDQAGMHISPSDRAGLPAIRARVEAISTATPARNTPAMSPGAD
jgi:tetratricopeptide (TPR) repeat protein